MNSSMKLGSAIPGSNAPRRRGQRTAYIRGGRLEAVCLKGPTCVGKTRLVVELASRLPLRIISVDSASVYRGLDIGTAKPGPDERRLAPHSLVDVCSPDERYSAARFVRDAGQEIRLARESGQIPLLVGGTMLYFRALEQGFAELPSADAALRGEIQTRAAAEGWPALHAQLARLDAEAAARISPNDAARIERALEVLRLTGRPISELWEDARADEEHRLCYLKFALVPEDRHAWRGRIEERFHGMLKRGWLDEARWVSALNLDPGLPATRIAGYRQLLAHLNGEYSLDEATVRGIRATKALGRRQLTWLRAEQDITRIAAGSSYCEAQLEKAIRANWDIGRLPAAGKPCGK